MDEPRSREDAVFAALTMYGQSKPRALAAEQFIRWLEQDGYTVAARIGPSDGLRADEWWARHYAQGHLSGGAGFVASAHMSRRTNEVLGPGSAVALTFEGKCPACAALATTGQPEPSDD